MKIQINIQKRHMMVLVALIAIFSVSIAFAAVNKNTAWHPASQIEGAITDITCRVVSDGGKDWQTVSCPADSIMMSGGCYDSSTSDRWPPNLDGPSGEQTNWDWDSAKTSNTWTCGGNGQAKRAYAICCKITKS